MDDGGRVAIASRNPRVISTPSEGVDPPTGHHKDFHIQGT